MEFLETAYRSKHVAFFKKIIYVFVETKCTFLLIVFALSSVPLNSCICIFYPVKVWWSQCNHLLTIQKFYIILRKCIYVFLTVLIKNSYYFPTSYSICCLVFVTERECVFCAVRTESLIVIHDKHSL